VQPDAGERPLVERIFRAFQAMKADQPAVDARYLPAAIWQRKFDQVYWPLTEGLRRGDVNLFHFFLANFGTWKVATGIESSAAFIHQHMRLPLGKLYLRHAVFDRQLKVWQMFYSGRRPITALSYPRHGNQAGAFIQGSFVGMGSYFNEIYGAWMASLLDKVPQPAVAELGAGYGKLAYFTLRHLPSWTYVDFDLPETLCAATYYLLKTYPTLSALLYGEDVYGPHQHQRHHLIFRPAWDIERIGAHTIDLFINKNSLGEMNRQAVVNYIDHIAQATRGYFFHMNHDVRRELVNEGESGVLASEYPVPESEFRLVCRYPDLGHLCLPTSADWVTATDIFFYLYERRASG